MTRSNDPGPGAARDCVQAAFCSANRAAAVNSSFALLSKSSVVAVSSTAATARVAEHCGFPSPDVGSLEILIWVQSTTSEGKICYNVIRNFIHGPDLNVASGGTGIVTTAPVPIIGALNPNIHMNGNYMNLAEMYEPPSATEATSTHPSATVRVERSGGRNTDSDAATDIPQRNVINSSRTLEGLLHPPHANGTADAPQRPLLMDHTGVCDTYFSEIVASQVYAMILSATGTLTHTGANNLTWP